MRRLFAVVAGVMLAASWVCACTPRPGSVQPVAAAMLEALETRQVGVLESIVDDASAAASSIEETWQGMQAEALATELTGVHQADAIATATYRMSWQLPRERELSYEAQMTLTRTGDEWIVRWQPSILHPKLGAGQHLELRAIPAREASVVSSDGVEVLRPGVVFRVLVEPRAMRSAPETARTLAAALNGAHEHDRAVPLIDAASLTTELESASSTYSVAVIPSAAKNAVEAALGAEPAVRLNEEAAMVTADPGFAPDIMARVSELVADDLDGSAGWGVSVVNAEGAELEQLMRHDPQVAPSVDISLDVAVQRAAEQALAPIAKEQAMIVAIRPSTGAILALAQTPAADRQGSLATTGLYPPGSTFKIITSAAGVQHQGLTPASTVPCPSTMNIYGRHVINYAGFELGDVPLETAFARSCNTTFADISTRLSPGELQATGEQFGIGVDFSIPGLDSVTGSIPQGNSALDRTEAGYGQGHDLVSPFGMALVAATVAHGSTPLPFLVRSEHTQVDKEVEGLTPRTAEYLRELMAAVTAPGGTAAGMQAQGDIRGKTGEAEIAGGSHSWFTGYRVDDDIAFATLVVHGGGSQKAVALTDAMLTQLDGHSR